MRTTGHHTCKWEGGPETVLKDAPFWAPYDKKTESFQFLGSGYYFWDFNKDFAIAWGRGHYKGNFFVLEYELNLPDVFFLDLVGRRQDLAWLYRQRNKWGPELGMKPGERWTIGEFIEILKELNAEEQDLGIFPFKAIRAIDLDAKTREQFLVEFVEGKDSYMNFDPRFVICLIEKNDVLLLSKKIIYDSSRER